MSWQRPSQFFSDSFRIGVLLLLGPTEEPKTILSKQSLTTVFQIKFTCSGQSTVSRNLAYSPTVKFSVNQAVKRALAFPFSKLWPQAFLLSSPHSADSKKSRSNVVGLFLN